MNNEKIIVPLVTKPSSIIFPSAFDGIIGQGEAIKKLKFFVNSHSQITPFPTMLFTGSQGLGKSFMAEKVAKALDRDKIEINCGTIDKSEDFITKVLLDGVANNGRGKVIFLDEAHQLSSEITTILLSLLNPNTSNKNTIAYNNWLLEYDFSNITTILATTDAHKVFKPLLNRCTKVYFNTYSNEDLFGIIQQYLGNDIVIESEKLDISYACRGRARDAFVLSENIKRYCIMNDTSVFNKDDWKNLKSIFSIHSKGLNSSEVELMKIIDINGPMSCNNLAIKMGVNASNIESELEVRLRELGLITSSPKGRCLTKYGKKYLQDELV